MRAPAIVVSLGLLWGCNQSAVEHESRIVEVTETMQAQPNTVHEACILRATGRSKTIVRERFEQTSSTHLKHSRIASS
jgi:hypothetical protein